MFWHQRQDTTITPIDLGQCLDLPHPYTELTKKQEVRGTRTSNGVHHRSLSPNVDLKKRVGVNEKVGVDIRLELGSETRVPRENLGKHESSLV